MIIGNPSIFAVESSITTAYERPGLRALGYFVVHIGGYCYGVRSAEATLLACSFDTVEHRLASRGRHVADYSQDDARSIVDLFCSARNPKYFDRGDYAQWEHLGDVEWAPDGDEAFDDSSHIFQLDIDGRVRLIAFRMTESYTCAPSSLRDLWLSPEMFYGVLQRWHDAFEAEWNVSPKTHYEE